jgi:chloramphenicol-sensitive protein RarD
MTKPHDPAARSGLLYGVAAYGLWGLMPLYFNQLRHVSAAEVLAHRIAWSVVFLAVLISALGRWRDLGRALADRKVALALAASTVLIAVNWYAFIYGAVSGRVVQASLGYFILPLMNVLLGMLVYRERLRPVQWLAVALAAAGVVLLVARAGELPWIALTVAVSFSLYGLVRKRAPVDAVVGLTIETAFLLPAALAVIGVFAAGEGTAFAADSVTAGLLALSGVITAIPLICFAEAVRRLRLTTIGFLQYRSPSIQFVLAVTVLGEPLGTAQLLSFLFIWAALVVFVVDAARSAAAVRPELVAAPEPG